jgi:beta-N-acetylhexosaminidase
MDAQRGIARRMVIGLPREGLSPAWERDFASYPPAGVIVFGRDFRDLEELRRLTARLRELARPRRLFLAMDEEGGFVSQLGAHLDVPPNALLLARGAAEGEVEWVSRVTGARLRALGLDWVLAPVADIHSEPSNPVIGPRSYGTDAAGVAARVGEALRGFRAARVASCLKHFPGHGDSLLDSHHALPVIGASRATLDARELVPFRVHRQSDAVMTAHVVVPALDPDRPATFSRRVVHDLLRSDLGFEGVCITDALEMKGAAEGRDAGESARLALEAGCDLLLFAFHDEGVRRVRLELARALVEGGLDRAAFDAARPRLARLDAALPEPAAEEMASPLESLTPPEWVTRLEAVCERGILIGGALPPAAAGAWSVAEPETPRGPGLAAALVALGVQVVDEGQATVHVEAIATRAPLDEARIAALADRCRERPTVLVALQSDHFLERVPQAALRVSACDGTSLTRRVVARRLAALRHEAAREIS